MLTILVMMLVFYSGHAVVNYGRDFITAFPENIAYYYPLNLTSVLVITALNDDTDYNVTFNSTIFLQGNLNGGQSKIVYLPDDVEAYELQQPSSKSIRITSDSDITVFSFSQRGNSTQTNVVQPLPNLGNVYQVPFPNFTEIISLINTYQLLNQTNSSISSYNNFRLLIINAEAVDNTVIITQSNSTITSTSFTLRPFEFMQMQSNGSFVTVTSSANISVFLTNPCLDTYFCSCSMVVHQLKPSFLMGESFLVPPPWITNNSQMFSSSAQTVYLTYGSSTINGSQTLYPGISSFLSFYRLLTNGYSNITSSQPVSLSIIDIGIWIELIPNSMFSACYLVHSSSTVGSQALIIVETDQVSNTNINSSNYSSQLTWNVINGTEYSWAMVVLKPLMTHLIWHPYTKMAVYVYENMTNSVYYGGPAIVLSDEPDQNGCAVSPLALEISNVSKTWQESQQYCLVEGGQLASPSSSGEQQFMELELTEIGAIGQAWIGLRRSLLTTDWYWMSGSNFSFTNWDKGQPVSPDKGLCASVRMEPNGNYTWSCMQCCTSMKPICYIPAKYFNLVYPYA